MGTRIISDIFNRHAAFYKMISKVKKCIVAVALFKKAVVTCGHLWPVVVTDHLTTCPRTCFRIYKECFRFYMLACERSLD